MKLTYYVSLWIVLSAVVLGQVSSLTGANNTSKRGTAAAVKSTPSRGHSSTSMRPNKPKHLRNSRWIQSSPTSSRFNGSYGSPHNETNSKAKRIQAVTSNEDHLLLTVESSSASDQWNSTSSSQPSRFVHPILLIVSIVIFVLLLCVLLTCWLQMNKEGSEAYLASLSVYKSTNDNLQCSSSILETAFSRSILSASRRSKFVPKSAHMKMLSNKQQKAKSSII